MKPFKELVKEEELNDNYLPNVGDAVIRLPFVNSNNINWTYGIVTKVFTGTIAEAWIVVFNPKLKETTVLSEYCYYLYPVLNATE
jgi:hypothetical protein